MWITLDTEFQEDHTIITFLNAHIILQTNENKNNNIKEKEIENNNDNDNITKNISTTEINFSQNNESDKMEKTLNSEIWDIVQYKREKFGLSELIQVFQKKKKKRNKKKRNNDKFRVK